MIRTIKKIKIISIQKLISPDNTPEVSKATTKAWVKTKDRSSGRMAFSYLNIVYQQKQNGNMLPMV